MGMGTRRIKAVEQDGIPHRREMASPREDVQRDREMAEKTTLEITQSSEQTRGRE